MILHGRQSSINVQKASWALREVGLEFEWIDKDGNFGSIDTPQYRQLNPTGRVPTLVDDGTIVRQSNVIVRYVAQKYGQGTLWPDGIDQVAAADYWMDWQAIENWRPMVAVFWGIVRTPPEKQDPEAIARDSAALCKEFEHLNNHLDGRPFVVGERFAMGDIPVGAAAHRFFTLPIDRPRLAHLEAWYGRLKERPAFAECVMVSLPTDLVPNRPT